MLGEVGPARALIEEGIAYVLFEMIRGDAGTAQRIAETIVKLSQENGLTLYTSLGPLVSACARLDDRRTGATQLRQALAALTDQGIKLEVPFFEGLLAEIEAQGDAEGALTRIDKALALAAETGERWSDAFLRLLRGGILPKCDPANTVPAEEAFLAAIVIAQQQKARSF